MIVILRGKDEDDFPAEIFFLVFPLRHFGLFAFGGSWFTMDQLVRQNDQYCLRQLLNWRKEPLEVKARNGETSRTFFPKTGDKNNNLLCT